MSENRLGKGLEALIRPEKEKKKKVVKSSTSLMPGVTEILLKEIYPNPNQPRKDFDQSSLEELAMSIRQKGVITPITVRATNSGYELIAGERRWRASKTLRKKRIPAYIIKVKDDADILEISLIENIQREDLNALEEAEAYAVLNSKFEMSHDSIAKAVGKKRVTISNSLRLLKLPPEVRRSLRKGDITAVHCRAILQGKTIPKMMKVWNTIMEKNLSVRAAESLIKQTRKVQQNKKINQRLKSPQISALENELIEILGTKVKLRPSKEGGSIEISYFSDDDLERIIDLLNNII